MRNQKIFDEFMERASMKASEQERSSIDWWNGSLWKLLKTNDLKWFDMMLVISWSTVEVKKSGQDWVLLSIRDDFSVTLVFRRTVTFLALDQTWLFSISACFACISVFLTHELEFSQWRVPEYSRQNDSAARPQQKLTIAWSCFLILFHFAGLEWEKCRLQCWIKRYSS